MSINHSTLPTTLSSLSRFLTLFFLLMDLLLSTADSDTDTDTDTDAECATAVWYDKMYKMYAETVPNPGLLQAAYTMNVKGAQGTTTEMDEWPRSKQVESWHRYALITIAIASVDGLSPPEKDYFMEEMYAVADIDEDMMLEWIEQGQAITDDELASLIKQFEHYPFVLIETIYDALCIAGADGHLPSDEEKAKMELVKKMGGISHKPIWRVFKHERQLLQEYQGLFSIVDDDDGNDNDSSNEDQ